MKATTMRRWGSLCAAMVMWAASGCATAREQFGEHARYSPAFRGYVLAPHEGSDDPAEDEPVIVLRDPLTGEKLRCRSEVERWREIHEDLAADRIDDRDAAIAAGATAGAVFAPLVALQPIGGAAVYEALLVGAAMYDGLGSDDSYELLEMGFALYRRERWAQAARLFERALSKDPAIGLFYKTYYFLGVCYDELGKEEDARLALLLFVARSAVRDVEAYRKAEARLARLGIEYEACPAGAVKVHL